MNKLYYSKFLEGFMLLQDEELLIDIFIQEKGTNKTKVLVSLNKKSNPVNVSIHTLL